VNYTMGTNRQAGEDISDTSITTYPARHHKGALQERLKPVSCEILAVDLSASPGHQKSIPK
jgi:hypothetical protein